MGVFANEYFECDVYRGSNVDVCSFIEKKSKLFYLYYVRKENYVITHGFNRLLFNFKLSLTTQ